MKTENIFKTEIIDYIKNIGQSLSIEILQNDKNVLNGEQLDIYFPSKKLAIQFNILKETSETIGGKSRKYHLNKTNLCKKNGIHLIHIFEDDWINKQSIIKSRLSSMFFDKQLKKIYARNCIIKNISAQDSRDFLNENHLFGKDNSSIRTGLYYNGELVSVMTFGKLRASLGSKSSIDEYEMYRFCSKLNYSVIGSAGKLLSYFIKKYNPKKIISYADKKWSNDNNVYEKIGFKKIHESTPNYYYTKDYLKKYHRFHFRKDQLENKLESFNPNISEWENMKLNGYDRIWDCGHMKYEMECEQKIVNFHESEQEWFG